MRSATTPVPESADEWDRAEIELDRHVQLAEHANGILEAIRASLPDLDRILADLATAAASEGMELRIERDSEALLWRLSLVGPAVRASGTVAVALETPTCATIVSRPDGHGPLQWQVVSWRAAPDGKADLVEQLRTDFRAAAVSAVLEATGVISG